jgi:hypothetical protein
LTDNLFKNWIIGFHENRQYFHAKKRKMGKNGDCNIDLLVTMISGEAAPGRQLQPTRQDEEQLLRRDRRQQVHLGLRFLGQLLQGLLRRNRQNCAGAAWKSETLTPILRY